MTTGWTPPAGQPDLAPPLRLLLVRHAETALTAERRYSGRGDVPLSPAGQRQAAAVAARLARLTGPRSAALARLTGPRSAALARLTGPRSAALAGPLPAVAVLTSPLTRCVQTAAAIVAALGGPAPVVEPDLVECDFGEWEGLGFAEVTARYPAEQAAWLGSTEVAPPGGESFREVADRVGRFVGRLRQSHPGQPVVVVTHVSPIKLILRDALGATDAFLHRCFLKPVGISIVDYYADGGVAVHVVNDTAHLEPVPVR